MRFVKVQKKTVMELPDKRVSFSPFLSDYKSDIIRIWAEKPYTEAGDQYATQPIEELEGTITKAVDANYQVLVHDSSDYINLFIDKITVMRLKAGFRKDIPAPENIVEAS